MIKDNRADGERVEQLIVLTGELVRQRLLTAPSAIAGICGHLAASQGKGIRTAVLISCASDETGSAPYSSAKAAAAVELLHMASLVHDDIIDDAPTRRGLPSVQSRFGKKQAVITGDWLLCAAMKMAVSIDELSRADKKLLPEFAAALEQLCLGELTQGAENGNADLSVSRYLRIIAQKTSSLFGLSAIAGAVLADCREDERRLLARYARILGVIFQIVDDVKDYMMDESDTLKSVRTDLSSGVVTLPLILSLAREPSLKRAALEVMRGESDGGQVMELVREAGIPEACGRAYRYADKAAALLERLENGEKREFLSLLLERALEPLNKIQTLSKMEAVL